MCQALWFAFCEVLATLNSFRGMKKMMLALSMFSPFFLKQERS